jgi:alanyl-tRNA synthetase
MKEMSIDEARKLGATGVFGDKYGSVVKVYTVGDAKAPYSREICGGPHATNTADLKQFKIIKEEAVSAGIRRIKAVLVK